MHIRKKSGSALVIVIIICAIISGVGTMASKLALNEAQSQTRYIDGQQALYVAQAAVALKSISDADDISGTLALPVSYGKGQVIASYSIESKDSSDNIVIYSNESKAINFQGTGRITWTLQNIELTSGGDIYCPNSGNVYMYLNLTCTPENICNSKSANNNSQVKGMWNDSVQDNYIDVISISASSDSSIIAKPIITSRILTNYFDQMLVTGNISGQCLYKTTWKVEIPNNMKILNTQQTIGKGVVNNVQKQILQ